MRVVGTAGSTHKREFVVNELGAEACYDSRGAWAPDVEDFVGKRGIDVALDSVGGRATTACRRLLAPMGRLVFYGLSEAMPRRKRHWLRAGWALLRMPLIHPLSLVQQNVGVFGIHLLHLQDRDEAILRPALDAIFARIVAGELRPVVDTTFPLNRRGAVDAHHYIHERKNLGKVVLVAEHPTSA